MKMTTSALGLKYIVWGLIFLMNPNVNIVDILPDFIGYLFIIKGLYAVASIYPHFRDASYYFRNLTIISVAKTISLPVLFIISTTEITWILLLAFVFGCLEIFYGVMAFSRLFEGIYYSAERGAGKALFVGYDNIRLFTIIFACFKPIASVLPELTTLSSSDYGIVTENGIVTAIQFRVPLTVFVMILSLVVGIVWFVMARKYFKRLLADGEYISSLVEKYERFSKESPQLVDRRIVLSAVTIFTAGAILALELKLDGVNYIPNFIAGAVFIAAFLRIKNIFPTFSKIGCMISSIYTAISAVSWGFAVFFTEKYIVSSSTQIGMAVGYGAQISAYLGTSAEVTASFNIMCVLNALEALGFATTLFFVGRALVLSIMRHGGKSIYELGQVHDRRVLLRSTALERFWIALTVTLGVFSAMLSFLQLALVASEYNLWVIDLAVRIIWVVVFVHTSDKIKDSTKEKYIFIKTEGVD